MARRRAVLAVHVVGRQRTIGSVLASVGRLQVRVCNWGEPPMGVNPSACIVVEDSKYGIQAARAAGMRALGYAGGLTPAQWLEGPNATVFDDMRELPRLLAEA
jgi:hypothetical protein